MTTLGTAPARRHAPGAPVGVPAARSAAAPPRPQAPIPMAGDVLALGTARDARPTAPSVAPPADAVNTPEGMMVSRQGHVISPRIAAPFDRMVAAARAAGVGLQIKKGHRRDEGQLTRWIEYGSAPDRVSRPAPSQHQLGTAIDFHDTPGAFAWLAAHAAEFGLHADSPEPGNYALAGR